MFRSLSFTLLVFYCISGMAQTDDKKEDDEKQDIGTEVVNVVKPYTPSISDAFKVRGTPSLDDSVTTKKRPVDYTIYSVPVASTFVPAKGSAAVLPKGKKKKLYNSYVSGGFGSFGTALVDFYTSRALNRDERLDLSLNHLSSQGGIDGVVLDDKFFNTSIDGSYVRFNRDFQWGVEAGYENRIYNWYGLPDDPLLTEERIAAIDPQQTYHSAYAKGLITMEDSFFTDGELMYRRSWDAFGSGENRVLLRPDLQFPISNEVLDLKVDLDFLSGGFDQGYLSADKEEYSLLKVGGIPSLVIAREDLTIKLGVALYYLLDSENSESDLFIYPQVTASYRVADEYFILYGGVEGDLYQNSYYRFSKANPFVSPTLSVRPTDQQYNAFLGAKGKFLPTLSYNLRGSYKVENDKPLFRLNPADFISGAPENYANGNSFGVVYDDVRTLTIFGALNLEVNRDLRLGLNASYFNYSTDLEEEAWNLPELTATFTGDYEIDEHWFLGADIFFVGERKDVQGIVATTTTPTDPPATVTLDSYIDVNINGGYRFNDRLSVFLRLNNMANQDYERWLNFPVQGFQILGGLTYQFNFGE